MRSNKVVVEILRINTREKIAMFKIALLEI